MVRTNLSNGPLYPGGSCDHRCSWAAGPRCQLQRTQAGLEHETATSTSRACVARFSHACMKNSVKQCGGRQAPSTASRRSVARSVTYAIHPGDRLFADSGHVARLSFGGSSAELSALSFPSVHGGKYVRYDLRSTDTPDSLRSALAIRGRTHLPFVLLTVLQLSTESTTQVL